VSRGGSIRRLATAVPGLLREVSAAAPPPLLVAGPPSAVAELAQALAEDGERELVRAVGVDELGTVAGSVLVYVVKGAPTPTDERALGTAARRRLPLVVLVLGREAGRPRLPYVLATDLVRAERVDASIVGRVAERVAARAGEAAWGLARGLPALRGGVSRGLVRRYALANAAVGAAAFVPGADLPALTLNQARLVLRLAAAHGVDPGGPPAVALAGVAAAGLGLRAVARGVAGVLPGLGWALEAGIASARLVEIPGAAHSPQIENTGPWLEAIRDHLARARGAG